MMIIPFPQAKGTAEIFLVLISLIVVSTHAFVTPEISWKGATSSPTSLLATTSDVGHKVELVKGGEDDERVVDVASFRNNMMNPEMISEKAQRKRDSIDNKKSALEGMKTGLLFVGPAIGIATYMTSPSSDTAITEALTKYAIFGGAFGSILAVNNYMGRSVHVPDVAEARNRIVVDLSEGLLRKQDVGFVAISTSEDVKDKRFFAPSNGVMAAVDAQLRNSPESPSGVRTLDNYPSHLHIKNMEVHYKKRQQGVGTALLEIIYDHAKTKTDAQLLTLEVEAANQAAVQLYRKFGFESRENPNWRSRNVFMVKELY